MRLLALFFASALILIVPQNLPADRFSELQKRSLECTKLEFRDDPVFSETVDLILSQSREGQWIRNSDRQAERIQSGVGGRFHIEVDEDEDLTAGTNNQGPVNARYGSTKGVVDNEASPEEQERQIQNALLNVCSSLARSNVPQQAIEYCSTHARRYMNAHRQFVAGNEEVILAAFRSMAAGTDDWREILQNAKWGSDTQRVFLTHGALPWIDENAAAQIADRRLPNGDYILQVQVGDEIQELLMKNIGNGRVLQPLFFLGEQAGLEWNGLFT